jgi:hypothetical protein
MKLNIGCGRNILDGYLNLDSVNGPGVELVADIEKDSLAPYGLRDGCATEILLSHVIEHLRDPLTAMQEMWRLAAPECVLTIRCPYGSSDDAFEDPTHHRQYFINSFAYFSQPAYWRADYGYRGDWSCKEIVLCTIDKRVTMEHAMSMRNVVTEMIVTLTPVKPIREPRRELQDRPIIRLRSS